MAWGISATLLSGLMLAVSRDTGQFGWLVLIAPAPLLAWALRADRGGVVFGLALVCGVMGEVGPMRFYGDTIPLIYGLAVYQGLMFALSVLFLRGLYRRASSGAAILGYAVMSAGVEYLYGLVSPNGSFGALGYAMVDVPLLLQTASVAGVAGLSFLAALIPAGLAVFSARPDDRVALATWVAPVAVALAWGLWSLAQPSGPTLRIALLSDDRQAGRVSKDAEASAEIAAGFERQIAQAAAQKPVITVIPEKILGQEPRLVPPGGVVVAGLDLRGPQGERLNAAIVQRSDALAQTYLKKRMIPGLESRYSPGRGELITQIDGQVVGVAICKDMDFAQDLRLYGRRNVALMLAPAWDFGSDRYLHGRMAVVRGVENGFALARTASQGLMTLSDANGRIVAEAASEPRPKMLVGDLPVGRGGTLYSRIGDVFGQACVALWLVLTALLLWRKPAEQGAR